MWLDYCFTVIFATEMMMKVGGRFVVMKLRVLIVLCVAGGVIWVCVS